MIEKIRDPQTRVHFAVGLLVLSLVCWPATHALMLLTDPPENTWVFHVLLAISWLAITMTCLDIIATADVRKEQDKE